MSESDIKLTLPPRVTVILSVILATAPHLVKAAQAAARVLGIKPVRMVVDSTGNGNGSERSKGKVAGS